MPTRGAFITLEGIEGVGKSTSIGCIERLIADAGHAVIVTREPGGTPLGEHIRDWILDAEHEKLSPEVEALLMFAARGYHMDNVIRPALAAGLWVICDRFTDATYAYQGGGRGADRGLLDTLRNAVHAGIDPDLTLLLDAPVEIGRARIAGRAPDHFERESREFFERVRACYLALAAEAPDRFKVVDATASLENVEQHVEAALAEFLLRFARESNDRAHG
jgi:dTMP kinase